jgi:hypothetical protein
MTYSVVILLKDDSAGFGSIGALPDLTPEITGPCRLPPVSFTVNMVLHQMGLKLLGHPSNWSAALGGRSFAIEFADPDGKVVRRASNCYLNISDLTILAQPPDVPADINIIATDVSDA